MIDFFLLPLQGSFKPGQDILFQLVLADPDQLNFPLEINLKIWHIFNPVGDLVEIINNVGNLSNLILSWSPPAGIKGGFGVQATLTDTVGILLGSATTAFDILDDWTEFPRYGFLSDFFPNREDVDETLLDMLRFHINGIQYYDWQYRHDQLISPENNYLDPLGRELSLDTIKDFLQNCKNYRISSMPYMAVYAASLAFWKKHPEWALYDPKGEPYYFEDFLGIMDPSPNSPWIEHIKKECGRVISKLDFDGIHIDQYGEPREGLNAAGESVDLPAAFQRFINELKSIYPQATVVFNAVKNWPIESLALSQQDFMYIEIWPPNTSYQELGDIVSRARTLSGEKPVVIAAYIPAKHEANVRLADAVIFSNGGTRIELGEGKRLLTDPYFPKHEKLSPDLENALLNYQDFLVCYGDLIGPSQKRFRGFPISTPAGIVSTCCIKEGLISICLINQKGIEKLQWDQIHGEPEVQENVEIEVITPWKIKEARWGSPDQPDWKLNTIEWVQESGVCRAYIPHVDFWGTLVLSVQDKDISL